MTVPVTAARQATFSTDPADTVSGKSIRKGSLEIPVIDDSYNQSGVRSRASRVSSAEDPSPIYGSKSALQRFKDECRKSRLKPPPTVDDSSELDILSDVGLVGDSDSEVVPIVTPLSLSARSKLRKEPRIKVPSSKQGNEEPTIQEETTQDVLASTTNSTGNRERHKRQLPWQIRSGTVVVNKKNNSDETNNESEAINKPSNQNLLENQIDEEIVDSHVPLNKNKKQTENGKDTIENNIPSQLAYEPESSFYESDWHPRKNKESTPSETKSRNEEGDTKSVIEDKNVISHKYDAEFEPSLRSLRNQKTFELASSTHKKRPLSSGDEARSKRGKRSVSRRVSDHNNPVISSSLEQNSKTASGHTVESRPKSAEGFPSQTPIISDLYNPGLGESLKNRVRRNTWNKENEEVSGIPKKRIHIRDFNGSEPKTDFVRAEQQRSLAKTPVNMATSDGYDYESETFEEILQDRNAMVKAERTYQRRIKQLEEELKGMINQCQALSDENKELRKTIDSFKTKNETAKNPENKEDTVALAARIAKLEAEKGNLVKANENASSALKDNDNKKKQADIVFVENTKLKNKNSELEKKISALEQEIETMNKRLRELGDDRTSKASVMEFKYRELEVSLVEMKTENKNLSTKVASLEKEKKLLSNTLDEKRTELNEVIRAMQNETVTETDLKQSQQKLDDAQKEITSVKMELDDMRRSLHESEANKEKLRNTIAQRDAEIKRARNDQEHKNRVIVDLRYSVEKAKEEIQRHQEFEASSRDLEKETNALKSRIGSLKAEIESSLQENQRLKQDREEVSHELNRLRNENAAAGDAINESKRYFRKWEHERESRNKAEVELARKQEEVDSLDSRVKDSGNKINVLYSRLRALEDDKNRYKGPNSQELETNNKILHDENKKLRQMLIERNIELVNKEKENELVTSRMDVLERKQKDAEVRVRQLSGWVSSVDSTSNASGGKNQEKTREHLPPRHPKAVPSKTSIRQHSQSTKTNSSQNKLIAVEPQIAFVSPRSRKKGVKRNAHHTLTPPPGWEKSQSAETEASNHTPCSLPLIDTKSSTPTDPNGGYFQMYRERMRRMQERQF